MVFSCATLEQLLCAVRNYSQGQFYRLYTTLAAEVALFGCAVMNANRTSYFHVTRVAGEHGRQS